MSLVYQIEKKNLELIENRIDIVIYVQGLSENKLFAIFHSRDSTQLRVVCKAFEVGYKFNNS